MHYLTFAAACLLLGTASPRAIEPQITETRTVSLTQTVTLHDVPAGAGQVRMWVPVPSDRAWQRVVDWEVVSAPGTWRVVHQEQGRGDFIYTEVNDLSSTAPPASPPASKELSIVVKCTFEREGVHFPLDQQPQTGEIQPALFEDSLDRTAPLMQVDERIQSLADKACGQERDPARQALLLCQAVADMADHYSKDPTKPTCGRGAAGDCLEQGGGCCTDLHSLFIAMARARNIPARIQYGYRLLDAKAGSEFDPGYRCWVEYFVPGAGWVPTDIVASDNAGASHPQRWASLSAQRVWLWEGRSFELTPPAKAGPIHTMICGWAEIDGKAVDPLPASDGTPSKLRRTVRFEVANAKTAGDAATLPQ